MAGDWIKMRLNLVTHPKVMRIAESLVELQEYRDWSGLHWAIPVGDEREARYDALRITRYVTVGALLRYWGYVNEHIDDKGRITGLWPDDIDQIAGVPGFCAALEAVEWIKFDGIGGAVSVPNFNKYNVSGANRGMTNAERQRAYRERKKSNGIRNVTPRNESNAREEKSREEKKEQQTAEVFVLPDWLPAEAWKAWLEVRKKNKAPNTPRALKLAVGELERLRSQGFDPGAVLDQSTLKGWKSVYPLKPELAVVSAEPKTALCDYCSHPSSGTVNGRRACDGHWQMAMDNVMPRTGVTQLHMRGVVAKPVAGA